MKFEGRTLNILKNFSTINPSIIFKEGTSLSTMSPNKTVLAKATISEDIPKKFAIADLNKFLGALSLIETPSLEVGEKHLVISSGNQQINFTFADDSLIVAPTKDVVMPPAEVEFNLSEAALSGLIKAMAVLRLSEVAITGTGGELFVETISVKNSSSDTFRVKIGETPHTFRAIIRSENLKLISGNYKVKVSKNGIAEFTGDNITYWVATEASSTFES